MLVIRAHYGVARRAVLLSFDRVDNWFPRLEEKSASTLGNAGAGHDSNYLQRFDFSGDC